MPRSAIALRIAAVVAAAAAIYWLCILPYRGAAVEAEVRRRSVRMELLERQRAVILARQNLVNLDRVAAARRLAPSWYMLYAGNLVLQERWRDAVDVYTQALGIDQRPEIYLNRGLVHLHLDEVDAAIADMATAARFDSGVLQQINGDLRERVAAAAGIR